LGNKEIQNPRCEPIKLKEAREQFERAYLVQVHTTVKGNVSRAAELAGKDRAEFYKLLRKYALDPGTFKGDKIVGS
jgi:two-component system response regulator GlrR